MISAALSAVSASGKYRSRFSTWVRKSSLHSSAMVTKHSPMSMASIGRLLLITTVCLVGLALKSPTGISLRRTDLFFQIDLNVFHLDHVSMCFGRSYLARDDAVLQHPSRLSFADVEHFIKLLQGDFSVLQHVTSPPRHRQGACQASCPPRP